MFSLVTGLWNLTSLSKIFQFYRGCQCNWRRKRSTRCRTDKLYHIMLYRVHFSRLYYSNIDTSPYVITNIPTPINYIVNMYLLFSRILKCGNKTQNKIKLLSERYTLNSVSRKSISYNNLLIHHNKVCDFEA
jgi:hypothetical protein